MLQSIEHIESRANEAPSLLQLLTGVAGILLATYGFALAMLWLPGSTAVAAVSDAALPAMASADKPRGEPKCPECGTIGTTRQILPLDEPPGERLAAAVGRGGGRQLVALAKNYEVTVRMQDGSQRVFLEASATHWRQGERIILIDGSSPSND